MVSFAAAEDVAELEADAEGLACGVGLNDSVLAGAGELEVASLAG